MKKLVFVTVLFLVLACGGRKGLSEYDDPKNGLHLQVPNKDWVIVVKDNCEAQVACWYMVNTENYAGIYLTEVNKSGSPLDAINDIRRDLLAAQTKQSDYILQVGEAEVTSSNDLAWMSWGQWTSGNLYTFHAAYLRPIRIDTTIYMFTAGSLAEYNWETKKDFLKFLGDLREKVVEKF